MSHMVLQKTKQQIFSLIMYTMPLSSFPSRYNFHPVDYVLFTSQGGRRSFMPARKTKLVGITMGVDMPLSLSSIFMDLSHECSNASFVILGSCG